MSNLGNFRPPPAYQEYASDMLANMQYRMMSLSERGLLDTMRKECWVNGRIPMGTTELANYLRINLVEIEQCLSSRVLSFFVDRTGFLICPELEQYREKLLERHQKMAAGGQRGGQTTQNRAKLPKAPLEATLKPLSGEELSGEELSGVEKQSLGKNITTREVQEWTEAYDSAPDIALPYTKESQGS